MKHLILTLIAICVTLSLSAQQLTVKKSKSAEEAMLQISKSRQPKEAMGYRVGIFFDNGQFARSKATQAKEKFEEEFKDEPVHISYDSPYYKVSAGNCLTEEEAIILFERIRPVFPDAYVMRERLKMSEFIIEKDYMIVSQSESQDQDEDEAIPAETTPSETTSSEVAPSQE